MLDSIGVPLQVNDWVAFYKTGAGKALTGQIVTLNQNSVVIRGKGKKTNIRRIGNQVVKIPNVEPQQKPVLDAIGCPLNVGDWVAMTSVGTDKNRYIPYSEFSGKIVFAEIKILKNSMIHVLIPNKTKCIKKAPIQLVKVSPEQVTLYRFST